MHPSSVHEASQGPLEMVSTAIGHHPGLAPGAQGCLSPGDGVGSLEALVTQAV